MLCECGVCACMRIYDCVTVVFERSHVFMHIQIVSQASTLCTSGCTDQDADRNTKVGVCQVFCRRVSIHGHCGSLCNIRAVEITQVAVIQYITI